MASALNRNSMADREWALEVVERVERAYERCLLHVMTEQSRQDNLQDWLDTAQHAVDLGFGVEAENSLARAKMGQPNVDNFWAKPLPEIISVKDAALKFGKSKSTIYRWLASGKLNGKKVKGRWQIEI